MSLPTNKKLFHTYMPAQKPSIALLTDHRYTAKQAREDDWYLGNILKDDHLLMQALEKRGIASQRLDWADPKVDWATFDAIVFRTTWDYYERIDEFSAWLKETESKTRVLNSPGLIWWNMDKHYLADLEKSGVPIVPSVFVEKKSQLELSRILDENDWAHAVIKPCISGGAWHTYLVNTENAPKISQIVQPLLENHAFLVQPFLEDVRTTGEDTLMVFDGTVTHAVRKVPKPGDFRVQDDHGGTVHHHDALPEQIQLAEKAMAACPSQPVYGRVDMVRNAAGKWVIMELEIIEPELWLRFDPKSAEVFADALGRVVL